MMNGSMNKSRGFALIVSLVFLVVLTLVGLSAAGMTVGEQKMYAAVRDRAVALEAAELALRDAERDIVTSGRVNGIVGFTPGCEGGLCWNGPSGYSTPSWKSVDMTDSPSVEYGTHTGASPIDNVASQPRYIIEGRYLLAPGNDPEVYYLITARAVGENPDTVVVAQELFKI